MIEVKDVSFSYNGKGQVLDRVNLKVEKGESVVLCGDNGAGKTTLARLMKGILVPASGDVCVDGMNTKQAGTKSEVCARVGLLFTNPDNQIFASTVRQDMAFGLENLCVERREIKRRLEFVSGLLGLEKLLDMPVHFLSAGEKEKVALAGMLVMEPDYLILDNPSLFSGKGGIARLKELITASLPGKEAGFVHIVNYAEDIPPVCRVIEIEQGRISVGG